MTDPDILPQNNQATRKNQAPQDDKVPHKNQAPQDDKARDTPMPPYAEESAQERRTFSENIAQGQVGLGVDIVEIDRMKRILKRTPSFAEKVFSENEREYCNTKAHPEAHYATRFAAKEAVLKALGTGFSEGIGPRDVEVGRSSKGRPYAILKRRAKEVADEYGVIELPLSLSYTHNEAIACAMAITEESVRASEERVDPMEELAQQFKQARSLLDEIEPKQSNDGANDKKTVL